jgi:hypothetical protein
MCNDRLSFLGRAVLLAIIALGASASSTWAHKNNTVASLSFSSSPAIVGSTVVITGTVLYDGTESTGSSTNHSFYPDNGAPITTGSIQLQQLRLNGNPTACGTAGADYVNLAQGAPNGSGQFSTLFSTFGFGGQTIGFRAHHPNSGGAHGDSESKSDCYNLTIIVALDPFPDGTTSYTQGFFGASPNGEAVVAYLMDGVTCEGINFILTKAGVAGTPYDCYTRLPLLLTGTVGPGPGKDGGFLPAGFDPGQNMAAQMITLLLNLNLSYVLSDGAIPMDRSFYINIDVLEDLFGNPPASSTPPTYVDPILNIPELGSCSDANLDGMCDTGSIVLSGIGAKVSDLDAAGTTVEDIFLAAYSLLTSGDATTVVNGVTLSVGELTDVIGLINESYDEGAISGFVTSFDAD